MREAWLEASALTTGDDELRRRAGTGVTENVPLKERKGREKKAKKAKKEGARIGLECAGLLKKAPRADLRVSQSHQFSQGSSRASDGFP